MKANGKAESIRDWSGKCLPLFLALAIGAGCGKPTELSAAPDRKNKCFGRKRI